MEYQVWTKDEYEGWKKVDCGDLPAAKRELQKALLEGKEPLLTVVIPYDFNIRIEGVDTEEKISAREKYKKGIEGLKKEELIETKESKPKPDKGPGAESESEVRPGAPEPVPELDQGSGDSGAGDSVPGK